MTREEARQSCKSDPFFLSDILGYDFSTTKDVHKEFFDTLPDPAAATALRDISQIKNRLILWPRGHFKTSGVVVHCVQLVLNFPDIRILLMQGNLKLTKKWLGEIKSHFDGTNPQSLLLKVFPEFAIADYRENSQHEFTVSARVRKHLPAATFTAASPKAVSTGQHYDYFLPDDLVHTGNFRNIELLDKLESEVAHFIPLIDPGGFTTMTGTRYHYADIYGRTIQRNQGEWTVSVKDCYSGPNHGLLFPERVTKDGRKIGFTPELLARIQRDDPEMFSAQYLNRIIAAKTHLFPEDLLLSAVRSTREKDYPKDAPCVMTVDLASSKKADSDHSVVAVGKMGGGKIWVLDVVGSTYSPSNLAVVIIQMALKYRPTAILVEQMTGAEFFMEYVRTMAREKGIVLPISLRKLSQQKDAKYVRIAAMESQFRNKRLVLAAGITDFERLVEEFTQFPKGRHDDRPDAVSMLVDYFSQGFIPQVTPRLPWFITGRTQQAIPWDDTPKEDWPVMGDGFCS